MHVSAVLLLRVLFWQYLYPACSARRAKIPRDELIPTMRFPLLLLLVSSSSPRFGHIDEGEEACRCCRCCGFDDDGGGGGVVDLQQLLLPPAPSKGYEVVPVSSPSCDEECCCPCPLSLRGCREVTRTGYRNHSDCRILRHIQLQ